MIVACCRKSSLQKFSHVAQDLKQHRVGEFSRKRILLARMIGREKPRQLARATRNWHHAEKETQPKSQSARALSTIPNKPASQCRQAPSPRAVAEFPALFPKSDGNSLTPQAKVYSQAAHNVKWRPCKHSSAQARRRDSTKWADWQIPRETAPCTENLQSDRP